MRQGLNAETGRATSLQLTMDFQFPDASDHMTVWLAVTDRAEVPRFLRWLSARSNFGSAPFFVDASRGTPLVGAVDPIVLLHPPDGEMTLLVPRQTTVTSTEALANDILKSGRPHGVWAATPLLHDGLLIKGDGGYQSEPDGRSSRSPFDLAVERLARKNFRENALAVSAICEATLRYPIPNEMRALVERVLVEAAARAALSHGEDRLSNVVEHSASKFLSMGYLDAAAEMRRVAARARLLEGYGQFELFEDVPAPRLMQAPKQGLRYIRCSLLPLLVRTKACRGPMGAVPLTRDDEAYEIGRIDPRHVGRWLSQVNPLSLTPVVGTRRLSGQDAMELTVTIVPKFMQFFADFGSFLPRVRSSRHRWSLSPQISGRSFSPNRRRVAIGEAATFRMSAVPGRERVPLKLNLLTPNNRAVILTLPILV